LRFSQSFAPGSFFGRAVRSDMREMNEKPDIERKKILQYGEIRRFGNPGWRF
jgi:hypothetical protein